MSPPRLTVEAGGAPAGAEAAALAAALTAVLDDERARAAAPDPRPWAYRSQWRRAAALEAVASMPHSKDSGPVWGGTA
ncbi:MAG: hypothetical protein QOD86_740 [Miltoncostaeaceae bacterium]|nr:hypothetical protein [Miltoncostaeaceae bacterium]